MNYSELKAAVISRIHRPDLASKVPEFLEIAHARLGVDINNPEARFYHAYTSGDFTQVPNTTIWEADLPVGVQSVEGVVEKGNWIASLSPSQLRARSNARGGRGVFFYAVQGMKLWVAPGAGDVELWYRGSIPFFQGDTDTNRLAVDFPQAYIYGAVVEAQHYTQDVEELQKAADLYDAELLRINKHYNRLATGGSPTVMAV